MSQLSDVLDQSVRAQDAPFLVAMVGDKDGVRWSGSSGDRAPGQKATQDTVFRIFSMTKAVGSTAAMILMDRGKLDPNTPVETIIPEFAKIRVLDGFDGARAFVLRASRQLFAILQRTPQVSSMNSSIPIFLNTWKRRAIPRSCPDLRRHYCIPSPLILASAGITESVSTGLAKSSRPSTDGKSTTSAVKKS